MNWLNVLATFVLQMVHISSYTYNLEFAFLSESNLNLWYAFEEYAGPTAPWHYLGPVSAGNHNVSFDSDLELDSGLYRVYLGAYSSGSKDTLTIEFIEYTDSGADYDPSSPFEWVCDTTKQSNSTTPGLVFFSIL